SKLKGPDQADWFARLEREHDNLRAVLQWAQTNATSTTIETGMRLVAALWRYWYTCGHLTDGRHWLDVFLTLGASDESACLAPVRANMLNGAGVLAQRQGHFERAQHFLEASLSLRRQLGDAWGITSSLNSLGAVAYEQDQYIRATELWEQGLAMVRDLGDDGAAALILGNLGYVVSIQGDYTRANALYEQSLALYQARGDSWGIATALDNLAESLRQQGDTTRAYVLSEASVTLCRELGASEGIAQSLNTLAGVAAQQGNYTKAMALCTECIALLRDQGDTGALAVARTREGTIAYRQGDLTHAMKSYRESLMLHRTVGGKRGVVACMESMASVLCAYGKVELAARLCGAATALRSDMHTPLLPADRPSYEALVETLRYRMGVEYFTEIWTASGDVPLDDLFTCMLQE
ncbi:MAG: tetratricopeptide repeat protein, partial [Ktedonobacterales bacterium]